MDVPYLCTITVPLPPPPVPPMPPFDQIFTIIFGLYVLIIGVLTCALVGVASRWCDIAADCRCGAKTITLPPQPLPGPLSGPKGGIAPRPLSAHARRGGPVVGPPQPPLPWGPLSGPRGEGGHLYCSPWALFRSQRGGIFCLQHVHCASSSWHAVKTTICRQRLILLRRDWHMVPATRFETLFEDIFLDDLRHSNIK